MNIFCRTKTYFLNICGTRYQLNEKVTQTTPVSKWTNLLILLFLIVSIFRIKTFWVIFKGFERKTASFCSSAWLNLPYLKVERQSHFYHFFEQQKKKLQLHAEIGSSYFSSFLHRSRKRCSLQNLFWIIASNQERKKLPLRKVYNECFCQTADFSCSWPLCKK